MKSSEKFRARFRFRVQKKLNMKAMEYTFQIDQYTVVLSPEKADTEIRDSNWLVMNARQFNSEKEAKQFAERLKITCETASVASRLGIDSGIDFPTSGLGKLVKDHVFEQTGTIVRDNVHGIDIFQDNRNVRIFSINAEGTIRADPGPFLSILDDLFHKIEDVTKKTRDTLLLLNYALMRPEPVAQIVFAFSAVEMLGQTENWSIDQKKLLVELSTIARESIIGTELEREEIAIAIEKSLHKLSLRQGVLRLLSSLNLDHLKPKWDDLYSKRSSLVHGLAPEPGEDYGELAFKVVSLCGQILLASISQEIEGTNIFVEKFYKLP